VIILCLSVGWKRCFQAAGRNNVMFQDASPLARGRHAIWFSLVQLYRIKMNPMFLFVNLERILCDRHVFMPRRKRFYLDFLNPVCAEIMLCPPSHLNIGLMPVDMFLLLLPLPVSSVLLTLPLIYGLILFHYSFCFHFIVLPCSLPVCTYSDIYVLVYHYLILPSRFFFYLLPT